ncbi:MAG: hypothetical protein EAZ24_17120 [Burkholderiales bacterium]|nr:MAG: hypothetical protein EAZ43_00725 [Betaproteobacteria bacterium]TAG64856.1 MAG: hypothetical protein EAZ24_17120 [Burkholderiales bacterium]
MICINMHLANLPKPFLFLTAAYFLASLGHFTHNAEFLCEYPNLPEWLTRAKVYLAWIAITSVGVIGFLFVRNGYVRIGLALIAIYAVLGFDGLGHYAVAPFAWHSFGANFTIVSEVIAAGALLLGTTYAMVLQSRRRLVARGSQ